MEFHLLIDDLRNLRVDHTARTPEEGRRALLSFPVTHLWMDHDLGDTGTGYQVITWALERGCCPPNVTFVTSNPVGRNNMAAALVSYGYVQHGYWYTKEQE